MRRAYYNAFSKFYDRFVALHSHDTEGSARRFLAGRLPVPPGGSVLDLCTGTATVVPHLREKVGAEGRVVGLDFSHGMLEAARRNTQHFPNVSLVEADAAALPFMPGSFDAVTCSHAFYELKGETQQRTLDEIVRVLKLNGTFLMMEHDVPANPIVKLLFYLRLTLIGATRPAAFLKSELEILRRSFSRVEKTAAPAGRSKVITCRR